MFPQEYLGYCIDATGIHQTDKKIKDLKKYLCQLMQVSFHRLINYFGMFIPYIATHLSPLYKLLKRKNKTGSGVWSVNLLFIAMCQLFLTSDAVLALYMTVNNPLN